MGEKRDIIKEKLYTLISSKDYKPMKLKELKYLLAAGEDDKRRIEEGLAELVTAGKIVQTPKGKYKLPDNKTRVGEFIGNKKGFGFVRVEGEPEDYFIPAKESLDAFHGDRVMIRVTGDSLPGKRKEAEVLQVLERRYTRVVGTYDKQEGFGFVIPDNRKIAEDIFVAASDSMGAMSGHKVVCELTSYGEKGKSPEGKVTEILGHVNDPSTDIISVVRAYDIPMEYPDKVMDSLKNIPDSVSEEEIRGRRDFRSLMTVTIDGEDAKDLDDAITLSKENGIYTLGVHIADVSNYVTEKSPLDKEALKRGTSCYLVDSVIPMLPHKLSNGICSLNQGEDRLTLSCVMDINEKGKVINHEICEGVINVDRRMSYTNVQKILERSDEAVMEEYKDYVSFFDLMQELSNIIRKARHKRGSIDFDVPETKIIVDKDGTITQCVPMDKIAHHAGYGDTGHNDLFGVTDESRDDFVGTQSIGPYFADYGMNSYSIGIEMVHVGGSSPYPEAQLEALWRRHGPWAIVKGLIGASLRRRAPWRENHIDDLNNYMRRDIGAPEIRPEVDRALQARFVQWRAYP